MKLYHATSLDNLSSIMSSGFNPHTCLTSNYDQALYYAETVEDEGHSSTIIELEFDDLIAAVGEDNLIPDHVSLSEPITSTLSLSEREVHEQWARSEGTWRDSLQLVDSVVCEARVPAELLSCEDFVPPAQSATA
jgi:hypothetical protein